MRSENVQRQLNKAQGIAHEKLVNLSTCIYRYADFLHELIYPEAMASEIRAPLRYHSASVA